MTQFVLVASPERCSGLVPVSNSNDAFLQEMSAKLLPDATADELFTIDLDGRNIDELMLNAQMAINGAARFETTELYDLIRRLALVVNDMVFWYSSDYEHLDRTNDVSVLLDDMQHSVRESTCEFYRHYQNR